MRRTAVLLVVLTAFSCDRRTPAQRGAEMFRPAAEKLGRAQAADLKEKAEKAYLQYLQETGAKDEVELGRKLGALHLEHYADALALTPEDEAAFKAGKFNDVERRKRFNEVVTQYLARATSMVGGMILKTSRQGPEWTSGLQLELAIRILEWELRSAAPH